MKSRFSGVLWPGLLAIAIAWGTVRAEDSARPIEFSKPHGERDQDTPSTSVSHSRLEQIESELSRPFQSFKPVNSMDGLIAPPPSQAAPSAISSRQVRELMERQREWMYLKPEEIYSVKTVEDTYKAPELTADGRDRKSLSPLERYLLDQHNPAPGQTNLIPRTFSSGQNPYASDSAPGGFYGSPKPGSFKQMEKNMRNLLGLDSGSGASEPVKSTDATDFFGFNNNANNTSSKPTAARLQQIEDFKQIYDFGNPQAVGAGAQSSGFSASPYVDSSFYDPPKAVVPHSTPAFSGSSSASLSSGPSTFTPSLAPVPPPAPRPAPVSPFFSFPRRN